VFAHVKGGDGGRYPLTGVGDVNTYALFAETILQITAPTGRAGFIVPTGIATDDSTKAYFGHITQKRAAGQPVRHRKPRSGVCLRAPQLQVLPAHPGPGEQPSSSALPPRSPTGRPAPPLHPHARRVPPHQPQHAHLPGVPQRARRGTDQEALPRRAGADREAVWAGEGKQAKVVAPEQNPWGISFMAMLHMSNDSHLFKDEPAPDRLPLYEAKLIHQFDHRWATYTPTATAAMSRWPKSKTRPTPSPRATGWSRAEVEERLANATAMAA
jgi:hypothetical protein